MSDTEESHPAADPVVDETPVDAPASTEDAPAAAAVVASEEKKVDADKSDDEDESKPKPAAEGEESTEPAAPKPKKKKKQRATKVNSDGEEESYEEEVTDEEEEEEAPKAPPKRPPPARAPPAPPPKIYEVPSETWSSAPVSNRVWEVDEQEEYEAVPEQEELNLSESELATQYTIPPASELGRGFFATVKSIVSKKDNTKYALKIIDKNNAPQFVNGGSELDILSRFNHPNIIKGEAVFTYDNYLLVVLELAAGGEFASVVSKGAGGAYTEADVHRFAKQLVSAVDHIHSNHVIHGDLAPENLFLVGDEKSELKVGGFSGAVISTGEKQNQQLIGNAEYQAPEILTNQGFTQSADMWAVGCILFFFVTGSSPFKDSNSMRMNMKIRQGKFEYDDACWTAVSPSLKDLISKLLVTDAASRLSASAVLNHQWITSAPGQANLPNARKAMAL